MKATKRYLEAPKTSRGNPSSVLSGLCDRFDQLFGDGHTLSTAAISELNDASEVANEEIHQDNSSPDRTTASKHNSAEAPEPIRPSEKNPEAPGPVRERTPLEGLANTVRNLLLQIDTEFGGAAASLTKYPQWIQRLPAFRMLSRRIHGRHAEILYRLGRRRPAHCGTRCCVLIVSTLLSSRTWLSAIRSTVMWTATFNPGKSILNCFTCTTSLVGHPGRFPHACRYASSIWGNPPPAGFSFAEI